MSDNKLTEMEQWWHTPLGQTVIETEEKLLAQLSGPFFGYHQLQIGGVRPLPLLNKFLRATLLSTDGDVNARIDALPFQCHSIENLLLQHVLEFHSKPHQILREAERVLTADGKLLLFKFNPFSLWGLQRLFSWQDTVPWCGHFYSQTRIRDWLSLLNFEVIESKQALFRPTFESQKWLARSVFFERWGRRLWPWFGNISLIVAAKRTIPLNPLQENSLATQIFRGTRLVNKPATRSYHYGSS